MEDIVELIDEIKEKITSEEYKSLMDKIMFVNKKKELEQLYKITYIENEVKLKKCSCIGFDQTIKKAIVKLDLPCINMSVDIDNIIRLFDSFYFKDELSVYRIIVPYNGSLEYIIENDDDEDEHSDISVFYSKNKLLQIEKYEKE